MAPLNLYTSYFLLGDSALSLYFPRVSGNFLDSLRWFLPPGTHPLCNLPPLWAGAGLGNSLLMNSIERSNRMSLPRWGYKGSQLCSGPPLSHSGGNRLPHSEQPCGAHGLWDRCLQPVWTWGLPTAMRVGLRTNLTLRWPQPWLGSSL